MKKKNVLIILGILLAVIVFSIGVGAFYLDMKLNQMIVDENSNEYFSSDNLHIGDELSALKDSSEDD